MTAAACALPSRLQHLDSERLASISYARLSHRDRETLERLLSASVTDEEASAESAGAVHYFQAYCVDFLGAPSAAAAAAMPQPQYERLFDEPLPRAPCAPPRQPRRPNGFQGRYFDAPEAAHAPGVLSAELRALLGIGPADPPPYLRRMRELGYPPGYVGVTPSSADGGEAEEEELCWHAHATEPAARGGAPRRTSSASCRSSPFRGSTLRRPTVPSRVRGTGAAPSRVSPMALVRPTVGPSRRAADSRRLSYVCVLV